MLDLMLRTGRYGKANRGSLRLLARCRGSAPCAVSSRRRTAARGLSLRRLAQSPHGIDLGPLEPYLLRRLAMPDGRIRLAPPPYLDDLARAAQSLAEAVPALVLIGRRHVRSNNSWLHNSQRLVKGKPRCTLMIHPDDAAPRGIADGARVALRSRVGEVEVAAEVTHEVMPGVVCLPHGWGHDRPGTRLGVASRSPPASASTT